MTGLMYYRPDDHINYLQECLSKVRDDGMDDMRWNIFIDAHRGKTPLPPIGSSGTNGRTQAQQPLPPEPGILRGILVDMFIYLFPSIHRWWFVHLWFVSVFSLFSRKTTFLDMLHYI